MTLPSVAALRDPRAPRDRSGRDTRRLVAWFTGDGSRTAFPLPATPRATEDVEVHVAGSLKRPDEPGTAHDYVVQGGFVTLAAAPGAGQAVRVLVHGI